MRTFGNFIICGVNLVWCQLWFDSCGVCTHNAFLNFARQTVDKFIQQYSGLDLVYNENKEAKQR